MHNIPKHSKIIEKHTSLRGYIVETPVETSSFWSISNSKLYVNIGREINNAEDIKYY